MPPQAFLCGSIVWMLGGGGVWFLSLGCICAQARDQPSRPPCIEFMPQPKSRPVCCALFAESSSKLQLQCKLEAERLKLNVAAFFPPALSTC